MNIKPSYKPYVGDTGLFHPAGIDAKPIAGEIVHVWSDTCVNLKTADGLQPTSVLICLGDPQAPGAPTGYFFVPDIIGLNPVRKNDGSDAAIEREIQAKGLTAPRITPADIEAAIFSEHYIVPGAAAGHALQTTLGSNHWQGRLGAIHPSLNLLTICVLVMRNGFTVTGESACASPENFDAEVGRKIARANAISKVWPLMGYELRSRLAANKES